MNIAKIILAWFLTVVLGSIFFSILVAIGVREIEAIPMILVISLILSALFSLPTVAVLVITQKLNENDDFRTRFRKVTIAHIIMFVLTVVVGYFLTDQELAYPLVVSFYALVGSIIWFVKFGKLWKEACVEKQTVDIQ